jgi:general secretion pathway protein L
VWTLSGAGVIVSDADGPATVLVPTEDVLLLAVDLPVTGRAKRLAALPFAIEDRIAEPIASVHLALGVELSPKRFLVGVVRHARMAEWIARIEEAGLEHAALVPDALALPRPAAGEWAIDLGEMRAVVRSGDGAGLAIAASLLRTAWEAAGRPRAVAYGAALPEDMRAGSEALEAEPLGRRLLAPALDLRQGIYAGRRRSFSSIGKRFAQVAAAGLLAHAVIATFDTLALRRIADRREMETRALVAERAPGTNLTGEDLPGTVADLLPPPGASGGSNAFLPAIARVSSAIAPLMPATTVRAMAFQGGVLTVDLDTNDPGLAVRAAALLREARIDASVTPGAGSVRIAARPA